MLSWILGGGFLMSAIAMVGGLTTLIKLATLERLLLPLVALAAGTLIGGAFFHMIPEGKEVLSALTGAAWLVGGFSIFLALTMNWDDRYSEPGFTYGTAPNEFLVSVIDRIQKGKILSPAKGRIDLFNICPFSIP